MSHGKLKADTTLISNDRRARVFEGDGPCFAAEGYGCLLPAAWTFQGKNGCTAHTATMIRKAARK